MILEEHYTVSELLNLNEEQQSKSEFQPKFGDGVNRNSKDNEKAVKSILQNAQSLDNDSRKDKIERKTEIEFRDYNKTTLDANFEYEPSKEWKERVKKLATVGTEKDIADCYDTDGNQKFYDVRKQYSEERSEMDKNEREKGIVGRNNTDHKAKDYSDKTGFVNESNTKPTKRLKFKNTIFLDESQVLARVPEDYKVDENRFYMQDKNGTDYLVECKADPFGCIHMSVENRINKTEIKEELSKIKRLSNYNYSDDNVKVDKTKLEDMSESISNFKELLK